MHNSYARISQFDLKENEKRFKKQWDPNQPFEVLIDQIKDAIDYAAAKNTPYPKKQIMNMAYNIVYRTGLFSDKCKTWRKKNAPDQTWTTFMAEFILAHQDLRESQVTVHSAGYHNQANLTQEDAMSNNSEALSAISELANAATSYQNTIATLTNTNAQLWKDIAATNSKLADALERLGNKQKPTENRTRHYCWSCVSQSNHPSGEFTNKKEGHVATATFRDKKREIGQKDVSEQVT